MIASMRAALVRPTTLDPSAWPAALGALRDLGFDAVDVPLVWREHERPDGELDLEHPRDLLGFFERVAAEGLRAMVRLGPVCAEEAPALGVPDRVLRGAEFGARTRRGNPVVTLDGLRVVPVPSLASARWRDESERWVRAASELLAPFVARGVVCAVALGPSALRTLRDAPDDGDHHPDVHGDGDDSEVRRATLVAYLQGLAAAAFEAGVSDARLLFATGDHPLTSPGVLDLAAERPVLLRATTPRLGAEGLWRVARLATTLPHGAVVELRSGGPAFAAPVRATHALQAARVALAAGPRAVTVAAGCVGHRWPGALLDERGAPRAHAKHWARALEAAARWPEADPRSERAEVIAVDAASVQRWWQAPSLASLPRAALLEALPHPSLACGDDDPALIAERALRLAGTPWLLAPQAGWCAPPGEGFDAEVSPPGAALLRAVDAPQGRWILAVSASEETATVTLPAGWLDESGEPARALTVAEGEVGVARAEPSP